MGAILSPKGIPIFGYEMFVNIAGSKLENNEKIKRWTVNNARNLKLSIILAKLKDVQVYVSSLSTLLQYLLQDIVRKIGNNQNYTCNFNITLSNQYCNYELRNFYQSNSRSEV